MQPFSTVSVLAPMELLPLDEQPAIQISVPRAPASELPGLKARHVIARAGTSPASAGPGEALSHNSFSVVMRGRFEIRSRKSLIAPDRRQEWARGIHAAATFEKTER